MMFNLPTLHLLRQERHPLAVLATLALVMRAVVIMLGFALSPGLSVDPAGVLCRPLLDRTSPAKGIPHDPARCICGPACVHGSTASLIPETPSLPVLERNFAFASSPLQTDRTPGTAYDDSETIRGPPQTS